VPKPVKNAALHQAVIELFSGQKAAAYAVAPAEEPPLGAEIPLRVLLAEDNVVNQKVALGLLERLGYQPDLAVDGAEALQRLEAHRYDLVLMDLQMPEMDGLEASREIRRRLPAANQPKIVALTANAMHGDRDLCMAAGMDDYIPKPVKLVDIAEVIRRQFGERLRTRRPKPTA
jgi:CheY-like chemotaxis protein